MGCDIYIFPYISMCICLYFHIYTSTIWSRMVKDGQGWLRTLITSLVEFLSCLQNSAYHVYKQPQCTSWNTENSFWLLTHSFTHWCKCLVLSRWAYRCHSKPISQRKIKKLSENFHELKYREIKVDRCSLSLLPMGHNMFCSRGSGIMWWRYSLYWVPF